MTDHKTSTQIEREIEHERSELAGSIDRLQEQFSSERIVDGVTNFVTRNGSEIARSAGRAAKDNPMALALTGIGLAWLMAGNSRSDRRYRAPGARYEVDRSYADQANFDDYDESWDESSSAAYDPRTRTTAAGLRRQAPPYGGVDERIARADERMRRAEAERYGRDDDGSSLWGRAKAGVMSAAESVQDTVSDAWESTKDAAGSAGDSARGSARSARYRAEHGYERAADRADRSGHYVYTRARHLRDQVADGTEKMSASARNRVIRARMRAYEAQRAMEDNARRYGGRAKSFARDEPLAMGALVAALGAAAAAMLPRTEMEDEYIGPYRDRAFDEADRVYREESEKMKAVAKAAASEGQDIAKEKLDTAKRKTPHGESAVEKAEAEARSAGDRVADAAKDEADRQNLGKSIS